MMTEEKDPMLEEDNGEEETKFEPKTQRYLEELLTEKMALDPHSHAIRLLQAEIDKTLLNGKLPYDCRYLDIYHERPTKITSKVIVPVREHPKFNFVGKIIGPKGTTLKGLQEETQCRMAVMGRGSVKDKEKEEEYRRSLDPKYAHLSEILHVEVSALAAPAEAHARMAYALAELRKYLIPDTHDEIAQQQQRQLGFAPDPSSGSGQIEGDYGDGGYGPPQSAPPSFSRGRGAPRGAPRGVPRGRGAPRGSPRGGSSFRSFDSPSQAGSGAARGGFRGAPRGSPRGGGPSYGRGASSIAGRRPPEDNFYEDQGSFERRESGGSFFSGGDSRGGYQGSSRGGRGRGRGGGNGGYYGANSGGFNDGNGGGYGEEDGGNADYQRRPGRISNNEESAGGPWKPRGGSRGGADRPTPYSRR